VFGIRWAEGLLKDQDGTVCPADFTTGYAQEYLSIGNEQILDFERMVLRERQTRT
jgi:hypothetical protein